MSPTQDTLLTFVLLALAMPALSCLLCLLIPKRFMWLSSMVSTLLMFISVIAVATLYVKGPNIQLNAHLPWFALGSHTVNVIILVDKLSLTMSSMVVLVSFLVHLYSVGFMADDQHSGRYFAFLGFFTFSMLGLVLSGNLLVTFCFWELVGFSSYLLIGHYRERPAAGAAATKAFIMNRIGDALFIVGLGIIWSQTGTFDISMPKDGELLALSGLFIFCGVIGKSAQLPLSTWLPDAMEGPTPVSALIHAATMVVAGVFLLLRVPIILSYTTTVVAIVGGITALYGGWMALQQYDLKKILAYSTISQLGLMIMAIGAGSQEGAFVHLITHAFFKACLFLAAGAIIHTLYNAAHQNDFSPQDIRNMGGFFKLRPKLFITTTIALAAICGIPFFSGFFSKEMIVVPMIQRAIERNDWLMWIYVGVFFVSSMLTVLYSYRLYVHVFFGRNATHERDLAPVPRVMQWPVSILAILCLSVFFWQFKDRNAWHVLYPNETYTTVFSIVWTLISLGIGYWLFTLKKVKAKDQLSLDSIYEPVFITSTLRLSSALSFFDKKIIDNGLHGFVYSQVAVAKIAGYFDKFVVDGIVTVVAWIARTSGDLIRKVSGGRIQGYLAWSAVALIIFIFWLLK